jgi:Tol biopolymer transport system component
MTPPAFDRVVRTCLAKDPDDRWQTAHDVMLELKWVAEGGSAAGLPAPVVAKRRRRERLWIAATAALAIAAALLTIRTLRAPSSDRPEIRLSLGVPPNAPFETFGSMTIAPDGRRIAFVAQTAEGKRSLWVRELDAVSPRMLAATEGASLPFWSPDSRFLGFFADGKLKKIDAAGGPPQVVAAAPSGYGGTWNREGAIVFTPGVFEPLYRVSAAGGTAVPVTRLGPRDEAHRWPNFLPDGRHVVFLADARRTEDHRVRVASIDSGETRDLLGAVSKIAFAKPGYVFFVRAGSLLAQPIDLKRLSLAGEPIVVGESVVEAGPANHQFEFAVSDSGVLAYRSADPRSQMVWVDRTGQTLGRVGDPGRRGVLELSPGGDQVAYEGLDADGRNADLWMLDLSRGGSSHLTIDPKSDFCPVWSLDGSRIVFSATRKEFQDIYVQSASGGAPEEVLFASGNDKCPTSWSPDGRHLLFIEFTPQTLDIGLLSLDGVPKAEPFIKTPFDELAAVFSPDGKRVAYVSDESGRNEVYVTNFPVRAGRRQISTGGGDRPRWRRDGGELYYTARGGKLMAVEVSQNGDFAAPKQLFEIAGIRDYAVAPDGRRFLVDIALEDPTQAPTTVVLNWTGSKK